MRSLRQAAQLTIEELSHTSGVSVRAIGNMERGVSRGPQRRTVEALAEALRLGEEQRAELVEAARTGRPRPAGPVPGACELPRGAGDFTGRVRELELLRRLAEQAEAGQAAVVATISGTGGIGKTALAVHAARHLAEAFPDGRYYVDLRGMDSVPLAPGAVLSRLLKALGVNEQRIPSDEEERAGLYRALLADRGCLIVLDNAIDEAQVRPLLPSGGPGMTIVTSRRSLAGLEGVRQIPLDQLSSRESAGLLRAIVGADRTEADPDGVAELARLCGNLPLAMRIAGNRLQSQPGWTISQLAGRLKDEERRLEALAVGDLAVATAFALSYQQLSGTARLAFRRLALAAAPDFGVPVAAVLTKADLFETEDALETLVELGLLTSPYTGRYVFHDLVRLFARAQLEQEESIEAQQEARRRMESWLLEVAVVAGRWFDSDYGAPPPEWRSLVTLDSEQEASDWLRAEETAWLEALRSAAQRGEHAAVVEVAVSLGWFADIWKRWEHWREVFELSSHAARAMGDRLQEAVLLNHLSEVLTVCEGRREEGEATALRALELACEVGDLRQQGCALLYASRALGGDPANMERELDYGRRAADLLLQAGDLQRYPAAMARYVAALRVAGRFEEALKCNLALVATLSDPAYGASPAVINLTLGSALGQLGTTYLALERWEEAIDAYQRALPHHAAYALTWALGLTQRRLGTALRRLDRIEEARQALTEAARLYEEDGDTEQVAEVVKELEEIAAPSATAER
ncbi:NB-ARC domain-containing protein [Streptosporangium lutulentum]|uniref:Tetratricopeptide (TPR) repeat protein/transcriptional regulator with XRE-family HTH domain n=1 Tax=Streptosporangium lutulentum TaxID=1461250 RepID=A0ABT9QT08_9ACTN|nr:NB-ARC domain-containing protein [Streptosporangium lutulentum]MDP9849545.1 tetratricopeptide (TPR) repeat protein/transcriptional regulator with XRE-family HTH domain [Streptosporangium lutulentum]